MKFIRLVETGKYDLKKSSTGVYDLHNYMYRPWGALPVVYWYTACARSLYDNNIADNRRLRNTILYYARNGLRRRYNNNIMAYFRYYSTIIIIVVLMYYCLRSIRRWNDSSRRHRRRWHKIFLNQNAICFLMFVFLLLLLLLLLFCPSCTGVCVFASRTVPMPRLYRFVVA